MEPVKPTELFKGEQMEEQLRAYFLSLGYFVIRGVKFKFHGVEVTDVDLWLYHRSTPISRERINVDIKNKKSPAAVERIIVAKGIMDILRFDRCIVATTDNRDEVLEFGETHGVRVLNGKFLSRTKHLIVERISEEDFVKKIRDDFAKFITNWHARNEAAKSRMIEELDFTIANNFLDDITDVLGQVYSYPQQQEGLIRLLYLFISYLFVTVDYILKDMAFIEVANKLKNLENGFKFGTFGETRIKLRLEQMSKETGQPVSVILKAADKISTSILKEFFGKNDNSKNLFTWAKEFEAAAYSKVFMKPSSLSADLRSAIGVLCDYSNVDRKLILSI